MSTTNKLLSIFGKLSSKIHVLQALIALRNAYKKSSTLVRGSFYVGKAPWKSSYPHNRDAVKTYTLDFWKTLVAIDIINPLVIPSNYHNEPILGCSTEG